jgi:hypothetical protein
LPKTFKSTLNAVVFAAGVAAFMVPGIAGANNPAPDTPADVIHPDIHDKVGNGDGTNANPNGANANGGNIHGTANVPGQNGDNPNDDGITGFANELNTVHGGMDSKNQNVIP